MLDHLNDPCLGESPPSRKNMIEHMIENRCSISYAWAVYMCINVYVYVYTYMHTCTPTHPRICAQSTYTRYTHTCMHTYNTCTHSDLDTCIHTRVCLCVCVRVCTRLFVRLCRYIKLGPQRSQYQLSHDGTTRGHSFPGDTSPSLSTARSGNGGSLRREVHGRGHGEGRPMVIRQRRVWSARGSALMQTSCCRRAWAGLTKCLVARLLSWWLLETSIQPA